MHSPTPATTSPTGTPAESPAELPQVVMFTKTPCGYCNRARRLLSERGIAYTEIPIDRDPHQERVMRERSGRETVPQVFIGEHHVGGYTDLAALDAAGQLDPLLGR